ncbi:hypothetical protein C7S17_6204 [Burkholderia thailandensis]|nr:hypothetical protein [Burkholderia thailandensis]
MISFFARQRAAMDVACEASRAALVACRLSLVACPCKFAFAGVLAQTRIAVQHAAAYPIPAEPGRVGCVEAPARAA